MTFPHRKGRFCFKGDKMSQTLKKKENRRVRYTRLALRESLLAQMEKQPLNKTGIEARTRKRQFIGFQTITGQSARHPDGFR